MRLQLDIELVDIKPYQKNCPSPYWLLLVVHLMDKGLGRWESVGGERRAFLPKSAVNAFMESEWANKGPASAAASDSMTYLMVDERDGLVKIGRSKNPEVRERTLQGQAPRIKMLAICPGNIEAALHKQFAHYRVRGEWFRLEPAQVEAIISENGFVKTNN